MRAKLIKRFILFGLIAGLLAFLAYTFSPKPLPVDMTQVTHGPMEVTVGDEGYTRVHDLYVVSAPLAGYLLRIDIEVGDPVTAGKTPLADILPGHPTFLDRRSRTQALAAVQSAESALNLAAAERRSAQAQLEFASADARRARALGQKGYISQSDLERIELALANAEAALDAARATERVRAGELENARAALISPATGKPPADDKDVVQVMTPVSGRVLQRLQESESTVSAGTPLLEIGNPDKLEIVVDLLSRDAVKVKQQAPAIISNWGGDIPLHGHVRLVEPFGFTKISALGIEEQRVNVIIDFTDPRELWSRLGHGYRVDAAIRIWSGENILQVPTGTLFRHGGDWAVFKVHDGRAQRTPVRIGQNNGQVAEITGGLAEGDTVVLHPSERIEDGMRVEERRLD